jgi:hypothetical protein
MNSCGFEFYWAIRAGARAWMKLQQFSGKARRCLPNALTNAGAASPSKNQVDAWRAPLNRAIVWDRLFGPALPIC